MNGYQLYDKTPNTIAKGGRVYTKVFHFETNNDFKERMVRVYLPSNYDFNNPNKRFKTIYMLDGKNLFDDHTSFVGEWGVDETIEKFIKEDKDEGYIAIGIDAPSTDIDRSLEMTPLDLRRLKKYGFKGQGYAHLLGKFIFDVVKKDIDKTFFTRPDRESTGVGGSSMGGLMAFYLGLAYPNKIKYCLNFSPAFFLFSWSSFRNYLDKHFNNDLPKMFFYIGGNGFERIFVASTIKTYNYFMNHGYTHNDCMLIYDSTKEHHESAWRDFFPIALRSIDN